MDQILIAGQILQRILLASAMLFALAVTAAGEADGPDYFMVRDVAADDVLNIREAPDAGSAKIGEIPPDGDGIRNLGCEGGLSFAEWEKASEAERAAAERRRWCRIAYQGVEGYVAGRFLAEGSQVATGGGHSGLPGRWTLLSVNDRTPVGDAFIMFSPDGLVSGSTGCNNFQTRGVVDGGTLIIEGPVAMTRMACPGEEVTAQENRIIDGLQGRIGLQFDPFSQALILSNNVAGVTLRLGAQ